MVRGPATTEDVTPARFLRLLPPLLLAFFLVGAAGCGRRETAVQRGNREQVLERGTGPDVANLDPQTAVSITEMDIDSALFEGLVDEDPVDLHPIPGVAEKWTPSPDQRTYTFQLRPNAKWSDGTPVTAADFVASWQRILSPALGAENAGLLYVLKGAEAYNKGVTHDFSTVGVKALGPRVLRVTLAHPTPYFLSLLTNAAWLPVPVATIRRYGSLTDRGNRWTDAGHLVGNGPFVLRTWRPDDYILVEKSPTYWNATHVRLHAIRFHPYSSLEAAELAFRAGQLHVTYGMPFGQAAVFRRESPQLLRSDPYLDTYFLRVNTRRSPLGDPRVRRALAMAIDRRTLVDRVLRGGERPAEAITPPGLGSYTPPRGPAFDPAAARRLLAAAGYPDGRGLPPLQLLFNTSGNLRLVAEALQQMWRSELGISVQLVNQEFRVVLSERRAGQYQLLLSDWVGDYLDPSTFLNPWRTGDGNNLTGWSSAEYDALLSAAARTAEPVARAAKLRQAESILLHAAPIIPLYYNTHTYLLQPSVHGWHPTLLDHHPYQAVWLQP